MIWVKSIFEKAGDIDGLRVLVDPVWPRGASREKTVLDVWFRDLAPSPELYALFAMDRIGWEEFLSRYHAELVLQRDYIPELQAHNHNGGLTIVHGSRNGDRSIAAALKIFLDNTERASPAGTGST